jgi:amidase
MPTADLHWFEITELSRLLRARHLSPVEVARHQLERIERLEPQLHAFASVSPDAVLAQARQAEARLMRREPLGPLDGVPLAVKDLCWTRDAPTLAGMPLRAGWQAPADATVVARLRAAGAVLLGKLQMTEGAFSEHHPAVPAPVNPWHPAFWSGVSSSGSGVATAAGLCFGALGSDTGGSIRFPSIANGVTGLKPTWGRVSRYGVVDLAPSLDHIGPMCRSAADCGLVLGAIAGADPLDPTALDAPVPDYLDGSDRSLVGLTVGIDDHWVSRDVEAPVADALAQAAIVLRRVGARLVPVRFPAVDEALADWAVICAHEAALVHADTFPARRDEYGPGLARFLDGARALAPAALEEATRRRDAFASRADAVLDQVDLLLIPGQFVAAPTIAWVQALGQDPQRRAALRRFTAPFDLSGHPTITLPAGFTDDGLPVAVQLVAGRLREDRLVTAGRAFQFASDWHRRHPTV